MGRRRTPVNPRVVIRTIQPTVGSNGLGNQGFDLSGLRHIGFDEYGLAAVSPNQTDCLFTPFDRCIQTMLNEFYRITFRKKIYTNLADLQINPEGWLQEYNEERVQQGWWCDGRTAMQTLLETLSLVKEKLLAV